ncbi:site-specific integrase [Paraburkholderia sediminicola]|uniref:site-specific integrase n=1 Tax=Paraburkholderia sediminicola TaxID=458836 RepID=UPI0038BBAA3F
MKKIETTALVAFNPYVGTLPHLVTARGGSHFDPHHDIWLLRELTLKAKLRFDNIHYLGPEFKAAFRSTLVWYAQNKSLSHLVNMYSQAIRLFAYKFEETQAPVVEISSIDLLNFKAHLNKDRQWYFGTLGGFLKRWFRFGYIGIRPDSYALLNQIRVKGNPKGVAIATMDPISGPFTTIEHEALQVALNEAYGRNEVTLADYVLCWLFMLLGMRPTQYAALKTCDVAQLHSGSGAPTYSVRMPRAKTRQANARSQFKDRLLTPQIGKLVFEYARQVELNFKGIIDDPTQAPLFSRERVGSGRDANIHHLTARSLAHMLTAALNRLNVTSERTGKSVKITAKRFRTTIGTRAAEEGHGELVIAELLDHSDTQNVGVYVEATPAIVERIDRAVAVQLAPLAQAFAGKLIYGAFQASRRSDPSSQIRAPSITGTFAAISSCGKHGFCGFLKPIACYTCNSFEPWLDGPHGQILDHLISERERLLAAGDARIACINDRTILAIAEVIRLCEAEPAERRSDHG